MLPRRIHSAGGFLCLAEAGFCANALTAILWPFKGAFKFTMIHYRKNQKAPGKAIFAYPGAFRLLFPGDL